MKHIPILFSTEMVQAILDGRKTQTRRVVKQADGWDHNWIPTKDNETYPDGIARYTMRCGSQYSLPVFKCPYGQPGDVLWVREEFYQYGHWEPATNRKRKSGRMSWRFVPLAKETRYNDNGPDFFRKGKHYKDPETPAWHKRLARFMPKTACRIWLKVKDVRVERLQSISDTDAKAEGIEHVIDKITGYCGYDYINGGYNLMTTPYHGFRSLWRKIYGDGSWNANHWVWVIEFERCEMPDNFSNH